jgi:hypothetical protein
MQWRGIPSGATDHTPGSDARAPHWVKVRRIDHTFTGYESADGIEWTEIGTQTVAMPSSVYWGLLLTSHDDSESCKADFDNVTFVPLP